MTVLCNEDKWDKSNIEFRDGKIIRYEKTIERKFSYIDYGVSMLRKKTLNGYSKGFGFDITEVFQNLIKSGDLLGFEVFERFYEIGSFSGIEETEKYILSLKN